jgi:hypothetical protein
VPALLQLGGLGEELASLPAGLGVYRPAKDELRHLEAASVRFFVPLQACRKLGNSQGLIFTRNIAISLVRTRRSRFNLMYGQ